MRAYLAMYAAINIHAPAVRTSIRGLWSRISPLVAALQLMMRRAKATKAHMSPMTKKTV